MASKIKKIKNTLRKLIPQVIINFYHYLWALISAIKQKFPSKKLIVIGVTGTKGKSTTCYLTYFLLQKFGIKTALSSSEFFFFGDEMEENKSRISMPGRWFLQSFLRKALNKNCEVAIIEITSEGLMQNRHALIDFDIAVFINIHPEHIEHHGGYEKYKSSKSRLFQNLLKGQNKYLRGKLIKKTIIANFDDKESDYFLSFPAQQKITYGLEALTNNPDKNIFPEKLQINPKNIILKIDNTIFSSQLIGRTNVYNILASFAIIKSLDMPILALKQPLAEFNGLAGRFEVIQAKGFKIIIDYAHTPVSVEELYKNIWEIFKPRKLLCLIGAAGGHRDKWKRPVIGEIAAKYCNKIVISNEDPFDEDPLFIMRSIEQGIKRYFEEYDFRKDYEVIGDRKEAISNLVDAAEKDDVVVLIGKGSEKSIETKQGPVFWDEKGIVLGLLKNSNRSRIFSEADMAEKINKADNNQTEEKKSKLNQKDNASKDNQEKILQDAKSKVATAVNVISSLFNPIIDKKYKVALKNTTTKVKKKPDNVKFLKDKIKTISKPQIKKPINQSKSIKLLRNKKNLQAFQNKPAKKPALLKSKPAKSKKATIRQSNK